MAYVKRAKDAIRINTSDLTGAIVSSGVFDIISKCAEKGLITTAVENELTSSSTNHSDERRAERLIHNIRTSLFEGTEEKLMDDFLCILYNKGNIGARAVTKKVASDYGGDLPEFQKLFLPHQPNKQIPPDQQDNTSSNGEPNTSNDGNISQDGNRLKKMFFRAHTGNETKQSPVFSYSMSSKPHGLALIINNVTWLNGKDTRHGSDADAKKLEKILTELCYNVILKTDLNAIEMKAALEEVRRDVQDSHDSFICCILSHGTADGVEGVDGNGITVLELAETLSPKYCKMLKGKPKLFFIQACRIKDTIVSDSTGGDDIVPDKPGGTPIALPPDADFLFGYGTTHEIPAYRKQISGSFYIQALCKTFAEHSSSLSLYDMLSVVHQKIATDRDLRKYCEQGNPWQMAEMVSTLRGNVYL